MARPKSKSKFKLFERKNRSTWYVEYYSETENKTVQRSTGYSKTDYSKEQVQRIIDNETGTKANVPKHSIKWLEDHTCFNLELECISEKTISLYKLAFRYLKAIYGENYSVHKLDHSVVMKFQRYLKERGTGNAGINTYLRSLHAAFERLVIDDTLIKNPFYRFKRLPVSKDKKKHMVFAEARKFLNVVNDSKNENAKHLVRILLYTGIRRGEVLSIERNDVNLSEKFYRAINIKSKDKHKVLRGIPDEVLQDFEYFINKSQSDFPFKVCHADTLTDWVKGFLRKAELSEDLHCHSLRHTHITLGLEQGGMTLREMQKYIDHASYNTTELYGHEEIKRTPKIDLEN